MQRIKLVLRVRALTRDFTNSVFREIDIIDFLNEGIDRFKQVIPQFKNVPYLLSTTSEPTLIPEAYQHLLAVYAAARCFGQDERHYQATTLMNEFEIKLEELKGLIESGQIAIVDPTTGAEITVDIPTDYVDLKPYYGTQHADRDEGVWS